MRSVTLMGASPVFPQAPESRMRLEGLRVMSSERVVMAACSSLDVLECSQPFSGRKESMSTRWRLGSTTADNAICIRNRCFKLLQLQFESSSLPAISVLDSYTGPLDSLDLSLSCESFSCVTAVSFALNAFRSVRLRRARTSHRRNVRGVCETVYSTEWRE